MEQNNLELTLFTPFSREFSIFRYLEWLDRAKLDKKKTRLVFMDNSHNQFVRNALIGYLKKVNDQWGDTMYVNIDCDRVLEAGPKRWQVIADNMNESLKFLQTPYYAMVEDDTIPPDDAISRLKAHLNDDVRMAQGTEIARSTDRFVGAWDLMTNEQGHIISMKSKELKHSGTEEITGGGFFCFVCDSKIFEQIKFTGDGRNSFAGPDTLFPFDITKLGYKAIIDWSVKCDHIQPLLNGDIEIIKADKARIQIKEIISERKLKVSFNDQSL